MGNFYDEIERQNKVTNGPLSDGGGNAITSTEFSKPDRVPLNFDSDELVVVELPDEAKKATEVLEFVHLGNGIHSLKATGINASVVRRSVFKGEDAKKAIVGVKKSNIKCSKYDGLVVRCGTSQNAMLFKHSPVCRLIAIEARFIKGLVNAEYSLFSIVEHKAFLYMKIKMLAMKHRLVIFEKEIKDKNKAMEELQSSLKKQKNEYIKRLVLLNNKHRSHIGDK